MHVIGSGEFSGAESHFTKVVVALQKSGLQQHVVMRPNKWRQQLLSDAGVSITTAPFSGFFDKKTRKILKQDAEKFKPDIVQTWMYQASRIMPVGDYILLGWLRGYQHLRDYRYCDHLCGLTKGIISSIVAKDWPAERIHHVRPFTDIEIGNKIPKSTYNTPENAPIILALGRLHWHKGFDSIIQAMTQIPDAHLWIAGEGEQKAELENFAKEIGVYNRVKFLGWYDNPADLYASADVCVLPSRYEPFGLVIIESWAYKVPIVITRAAGTRTTAQDGVDAIIVPIDDIDELAIAVNRILNDSTLRKNLTDNGFQHYQHDYTVESTVAKYKQIYDEIITMGPLVNRRLSVLGQIIESITAPIMAKINNKNTNNK